MRPLLALILLALPGCMSLTGNTAMTKEQIEAAAKSKDAGATCTRVNTPWGPATTVYLNVDKGVVQSGNVTVGPDCTISFANQQPMPPPPGQPVKPAP